MDATMIGGNTSDTAESSRETYDFSEHSELVSDQLLALLEVEKSYRVKAVPCRAVDKFVEEGAPLDDWRRKICQWSFRVIDHFRFDREVVSTGMNFFDRFLTLHKQEDCPSREENRIITTSPSCDCPSCKRSMDSQTYQLAAMTCVFLAVKLNMENSPSEANSHTAHRRSHFKLSTFVALSRGQFRAQDICDMEQTVLKTLQWKVSPPTPMTFVSYLITLIPDRAILPELSQPYYDLVVHVIRELSRYLTELAVCIGGECAYYDPSHLAYAAILVSMDLLTAQACPLEVRQRFRQEVCRVCNGVNNLQTHMLSIYAILQRALWPEMLLDNTDKHTPDSGHPISIARDYGLLDIERIHQAQQERAQQQAHASSIRTHTTSSSLDCKGAGRTPPGSPRHQQQATSPQRSPVSVAR